MTKSGRIRAEKEWEIGAGETTQPSRALAALAVELGVVPSTRLLTTIPNYRFRDLTHFSGLYR